MNMLDKKSAAPMLEKVVRFMSNNGMDRILNTSPKIGIALSGGADSIALLHIAISLGWEVIALHCNFGLRGAESNRDEEFVTRHCAHLGVCLHKIKFNVADRMTETGESIEMACRELRYKWFEEMARKENLTAVALGHHRDDNIETFFLNTLRGCGTAGAKGIPPQRDIFIRPMLSLSHKEITTLLQANKIDYVTDSSNLSNEYNRNKIRNIIIPKLEENFPGASAGIETSIRNLAADNRLLQSLIAAKKGEYVNNDNSINISRIFDDEPEAATLLYHILQGDIDYSAIKRIESSANESGKIFSGKSGQKYLLNRGLLISLQEEELSANQEEYVINLNSNSLSNCSRQRLSIGKTNHTSQTELSVQIVTRKKFTPRRNPDTAWFDISLLRNGNKLIMRHPRIGDRITPFGMTGSRLLSDIFSDMKMSLIDKRRQWVMTCGDEIIWIPGVKNSNLYRVTPDSDNILKIDIRNINEKS